MVYRIRISLICWANGISNCASSFWSTDPNSTSIFRKCSVRYILRMSQNGAAHLRTFPEKPSWANFTYQERPIGTNENNLVTYR